MNQSGDPSFYGLSEQTLALMSASPRTRQLLTVAEAEARRLGHNYIGQEHLLLALAQDREGNAGALLTRLGVDPAKVAGAVGYFVSRGSGAPDGPLTPTPRLRAALDLAAAEARRRGRDTVGGDDLLLGLLAEGNGIGAGVLTSLAVTAEKARPVADGLEADGALLATLTPAAPGDTVPPGPKGNV